VCVIIFLIINFRIIADRNPAFSKLGECGSSPEATGKGRFEASSSRYLLYVSNACPWAHRSLMFQALKGLEEMISISIVHCYMAENG